MTMTKSHEVQPWVLVEKTIHHTNAAVHQLLRCSIDTYVCQLSLFVDLAPTVGTEQVVSQCVFGGVPGLRDYFLTSVHHQDHERAKARVL